jgi:hypothetical protein
MPTLAYTGTVYEVSDICVDSNGDVWTLHIGSGKSLYLCKNDSTISTVTGTTIHGATVLDIATMGIDDSDVLHVCCVPSSGGHTRDLSYNTYTIGSGWGSWVEIVSYKDAATNYSMATAIDSNGAVYFLYNRAGSKYNGAFMVTNESGSWVDYELGSSPKSYVYSFHSLGKNGDGDIVIWYYDAHGGYPHYMCYRIWDVSASSLGSENAIQYPENLTHYSGPPYAAWDGSYSWVLDSPYSTSSTSDYGWIFNTSPTGAIMSDFDIDPQYIYLSVSGQAFAPAYYNSQLMIFAANYGFDGLKTYIYSGGTFTYDQTLRTNASNIEASFFNIANEVNHQSTTAFAGNYYYRWTEYDTVYYTYYDVLYPGTPISGSRGAFTLGGGRPTSSKSAWLEGDPPRSSKPAFMYGHYDVGGNTRAAEHAYMPVKAPSIPAFLQGSNNYYFDVVNFTANGSTGTQNITGSIGGLEPCIAFLCGWGITSNESETSNAAWFWGLTDGTTEYCQRAYQADASGTSSAPSGSVSTSACAGYLYSGGGSAAFNSWLTNGIQLNWTAGASSSYKCAALLVAAERGTDSIHTASGSWTSPPEGEAGWEEEITGVGFKPDLVIFLTPQGGCGMGLGAAVRTENDGYNQGNAAMDWNSGYFNYPGECTRNDSYNDVTMCDAIAAVGGAGRWGVSAWDNDGFTMKALSSDGTEVDTYWFAIKFDEPGLIDFKSKSGTVGTGNVVWPTEIPGEALMWWGTGAFRCQYPLSGGGKGTMAGGMSDGTDEFAGSSYLGYFTGSPWSAKSYGSDAKVICSNGGTYVGTLTSWDVASFTTNITAGSDPNPFEYVVFGQGINTSSRQHALVEGQSRIRSSFTRGKDSGSSSISAFFNVVDGQSHISCYMQGLNPLRTYKPAYTKGSDIVVIAATDFVCNTSTGSQSITTSELCGLTPKAVLIYWGDQWKDSTWQGASSSGSFCTGVSMSDGTTHVYQIGRGQDDLYSYFDIYSAYGNGDFIRFPNKGAASTDGYATFTNFITDGVQINWVDSLSAGMRGVAIFFAGSELDAHLENIQIPFWTSGPGWTSGGESTMYDHEITLGWQADIAFAFRFNPAYVSSNSVLAEALTFQFGWATRDQYVWRSGEWDEFNGFHQGIRASISRGNEGTCQWVPDLFADNWGAAYNDGFVAGQTDPWVSDWGATVTTVTSAQRADPANYYCPILFVGLGASGRRAASGSPLINGFYQNTGTFNVQVTADYDGKYNIVSPEIAFTRFSPARSFNRPYFGAYYDDMYEIASDSLSVLTQSGQWCFQHSNMSVWWDCGSQYWDQYCNSMLYTDRFVNHWQTSDDKEYYKDWSLLYKGTGSFIPNGFELDIDTANEFCSLYTSMPSQIASNMWLIGIVEVLDSTPAYMKGKKDDWRGRTPRGCYLEGAQSVVTSSIPAFIQVGEASSVPCYIEGFIEGSSTKAAFLHGVDTDLDQQSAFMWGKVYLPSSNSAYLVGQADYSGSQEAFVWGRDTDISSNEAYLVGSINAISSIPAWCRSGTDILDSTPAFLQGDSSRSSIPAYTNGFSATPTSSMPAFTSGGGPWPFTDDYTGADEDPWDAGKWLSTDEL